MKTDRLIAILMLLFERRKISSTELARLCGVSIRTIYRDMESINQAGIPIVAYPGSGGGFGLMENFRFENRFFSDREIALLIQGLGGFRSVMPQQETECTLSKLKELLPAMKGREWNFKSRQLAIDMTPWSNSRSCLETISAIRSAMDRLCVVEFEYNDRSGRKSRRRVEPYRLLLKSMSWYLEGFCTVRKDFRTFKLSRMSEFKTTECQYTPRDLEILSDERLWETNDLETITLRVRGMARERILDLFGEECLTHESEDTWIAKIPFADEKQGYRFILGLGEECELLGPEHIRSEFAAFTKSIFTPYF